MKLSEALEIAVDVVRQLLPHCSRVEIAGSVRRLKDEVRDIEVVCIPIPERLASFASVVNQWEKVKGDPQGKYTQRILPSGIKLDLFMATPENWGLIFAIRTGSANFSSHVLATGWVKAGYHSVDGYLTRNGQRIPVREEEELFDLIGIPWVEPSRRNL
jgi:DNA polymerase/3'-5' exonuclease PolX